MLYKLLFSGDGKQGFLWFLTGILAAGMLLGIISPAWSMSGNGSVAEQGHAVSRWQRDGEEARQDGFAQNPTVTATSVLTATATLAPTATLTPTVTLTPTLTATMVAPTPTAVAPPTLTPTSTITPTATVTPSPTLTATATVTPTLTPTPVYTPTAAIAPPVRISPSDPFLSSEGGEWQLADGALALQIGPGAFDQGAFAHFRWVDDADARALSPFDRVFRLQFLDEQGAAIKPGRNSNVELLLDYGAILPVSWEDVDWQDRLTLYRVWDCQQEEDEEHGESWLNCANWVQLPVVNDMKRRLLRVDLTRFSAQPQTPALAGSVSEQAYWSGEGEWEDIWGETPEEGLARGSVDLGPGNQTSGFYVLATSSSGESSGDYKAEPLDTVKDYQVGLFSGAAQTSYAIPAPPGVAGAAPEVILRYDSGNVDGMNTKKNDQAGPVGLGWSLETGSIQRVMRHCQNSGDLCVSHSTYYLRLNGVSSLLLNDDDDDGVWHLQSDPLWRIERVDGGANYPEDGGKYWVVTTPDGVKYRFGGEYDPETGEDLDSAFYVPVYSGGHCPDSQHNVCQRIWKWNLDRVEDTNGNVITYAYEQEGNYYNARGSYSWKYIRAGMVKEIRYTRRAGETGEGVYRMQFNSELRCKDPASVDNCQWSYNYPDTPDDLTCESGGSCSHNAATFWSQRRLSSIQTLVQENGGWRTVNFYDLSQSFPDPPPDSYGDDSKKKLWLDGITRRPGGDYRWSGFEQIEAERFDGQSGVEVTTEPAKDIGRGRVVKQIHSGDWLRFDAVDLGQGAGKLLLRADPRVSNATVKVHLDSVDGPVIAEKNLGSSNSDYKTFEIDLDPAQASGVHDLYFTFHHASSSDPLLLFNWFRFAPVNALPGLPAASYDYTMLDNRVNHPDGVSPMTMPRIERIDTQLGGQITFHYGQSHACQTSYNSYVRIPDDCYPGWVGSSTVLWNKWKVLSMDVADPVTGQPTQTTTYTYSEPTWGYNDEIYNNDGDYLWNDYRGHQVVTVTDSSGAKTEYRFYRGMEGDRQNSNGGVYHESITLSDGSTRTDVNWLRGQVAETRRLQADGSALTRAVTWYVGRKTAETSQDDREDPHWTATEAQESTFYGTETKTTRVEYDYDDYGNVTFERQMGDVPDATDNRTVQYDYVYNTTAYVVDRQQAQRLWAGDVSASAAGAPGQEKALTEYAYDGGAIGDAPTQGNLTLTRAYSSVSPQIYHDSTASYDALGRVISATDANGHTTTTSYDPTYGYVSQVTNALGHTVTTVADPATHKPTQITDANGHVTTLAYDAYHRLTQVWLPTEPTSGPASFIFDYHPEARPAWVQSSQLQDAGSGHYLQSWAYVDGLGRSVQTQTPAAASGNRILNSTAYNDLGQTLYSSSAYEAAGVAGSGYVAPTWTSLMNYQRFEYDELGNQTKVATMSQGAELFSSETTYDAWRTAFTDANGHVTERFADAFGQLRRVVEHNNDGNYTTLYLYDLAGNLTQVTDAAGNVTTLGYDLLGRKTTMTDPDMGAWTYQYDGVGNLTAQQDGRGLWLYMSYDALNRLTAKRKDSASGPLVAEYVYDAAGYKGLLEKSKAYTDEGVVEVRALAYDARNRLTGQEWVIPGAGGGTFRMSYAYNAADQQVSITYPGGNNGEAGEVVSNSYNDVGQLTGVSGAGVQYLSAAAYNPLGQPTELQLDTGGNGLWRNFDYDAGTLRLQTLRAGKNGAHDDIQKLSYAYDNVGNVLSITDALNANQIQSFGYDWLNRLTSAATNAAGTGQYDNTYTYDAIGNITLKNLSGIDIIYHYDASQPHAVDETSGIYQSFDYDAQGNLIFKQTPSSRWYYEYDYEGRLIRVEQQMLTLDDIIPIPTPDPTAKDDQNGAGHAPEGAQMTWVTKLTAAFLYDADGNRVKGTIEGDTTVTTVYIAGVYEWQGGAVTQYYQGPTGPLALRRTGHSADNGVKYLLSDHLRSTSVLVNRDGSVASRQYYHPFGDARGGPFSTLTTKRYTGQYHEEALGLYFYGARWYDPLLGRFTQADTLIPDPSAPQAFNRYAYTLNNPLRYTDPSGHRWVDPPDDTDNSNNSGGHHHGGCGRGGGRHGGGHGWNWRRWTYRYIVPWIPFIGSGAQIHQGFNTAKSAAQSPDFARQQLIYQQWSAMNCPGVCHRSPEATEAAYGEDVWRWRNQPRPDTPLVDAYSSGAADVVSGVMSLAFETYAVGRAVASLRMPKSTLKATSPTKLDLLMEDIEGWVGQGDDIIVIRNKHGDLILRNSANTRRFRMDLNYPNPHENPHMHLEWRVGRSGWEGPRIYPLDVEPR